MGYQRLQPSYREVLELAGQQHGVVAREQLMALGLGGRAIKHRIARGRLHPVYRGVYAVGRPRVTQFGRWMAAVLSCGPDAVLSHQSAAALWEIGNQGRRVEVSVHATAVRNRRGIAAHRRTGLTADDTTTRCGIPVTTPICTLVDIAPRLSTTQLEAAINETDKRDLANPEQLRAALLPSLRRPGVCALREILDRRTFALTESELERRFLTIVRAAGLPLPEAGQELNGFKVDFYWPELGLVVETDGLRYHRTAAQQARDRVRNQAHTAAGLTCLRFTHAQVRYEPGQVCATLSAVARRLRLARAAAGLDR